MELALRWGENSDGDWIRKTMIIALTSLLSDSHVNTLSCSPTSVRSVGCEVSRSKNQVINLGKDRVLKPWFVRNECIQSGDTTNGTV